METASQLAVALRSTVPTLLHQGLASPSRAIRAVGALAAVVAAYRVVRALIVPRPLRGLARVGPITTIRIFLRGLGFFENNIKFTELARADAVRRGLIAKDDPLPGVYVVWFGRWVVTLANPTDVKQILMETETFEKLMFTELGMDIQHNWFRENIVMSKTPEWKRHRKVVNAAFRRGWSTHFFGNAGRDLLAELDALAEHGESTDPADWMHRTALDALCIAAFGEPMNAIRNPDTPMIHLYHQLMADIFDPIGNILPATRLFSRATTNKRIAQFNTYLFEIIDRKMAAMQGGQLQGESDNDEDRRSQRNLLELMIEAAQKETFSREDLRANLLVFFLAGHDTTANALCYAIYLLGLHPEIQDRARAEVLEVMDLADADDAAAVPPEEAPYPTNAQQQQLMYVTKVIKEAMRLFPSVANIPFRGVARDNVRLASTGTFLPRGTVVSTDVISLHRSPRWWGASAAVFNPDRWRDGDDAMHPGSPASSEWCWAPFSGGPRICLGNQFSLIEQRVLLAMLLARYTWRVVGDDRALAGMPSTIPGILLRPVGIRVQLQRRSA